MFQRQSLLYKTRRAHGWHTNQWSEYCAQQLSTRQRPIICYASPNIHFRLQDEAPVGGYIYRMAWQCAHRNDCVLYIYY